MEQITRQCAVGAAGRGVFAGDAIRRKEAALRELTGWGVALAGKGEDTQRVQPGRDQVSLNAKIESCPAQGVASTQRKHQKT